MKNKFVSLLACSLVCTSSFSAYAANIQNDASSDDIVCEAVVDNDVHEESEQEIVSQPKEQPANDNESESLSDVAADVTQNDETDLSEQTVEDNQDEIDAEENSDELITDPKTNVESEKEIAEDDEDEEKSFVVSFYDPIAGEYFHKVEVENGGSISDLPEAPTHFNGKFHSYKGNCDNIERDTVIVALYEPYYSVYELKHPKGTFSGRTYNADGMYLPNARVVLNINGIETETYSSDTAYYDFDIDVTDSFVGTVSFYDENGKYMYKSYVCYGQKADYDKSLIGEDFVVEEEESEEGLEKLNEKEMEETLSDEAGDATNDVTAASDIEETILEDSDEISDKTNDAQASDEESNEHSDSSLISDLIKPDDVIVETDNQEPEPMDPPEPDSSEMAETLVEDRE